MNIIEETVQRRRELRAKFFPPAPVQRPPNPVVPEREAIQVAVEAVREEIETARKSTLSDLIDKYLAEHPEELARARAKLVSDMRSANPSGPVPSGPTVREITRIVADMYGVPTIDVRSARRTRNLVEPRQVISWIARTITTRSLPEIGRYLGGRDHTTILHGYQRVEARRAADPEYASRLDGIRAAIESMYPTNEEAA